MIIFCLPSFCNLSLTLEKNTPTTSTLSKLQDLNRVTSGKFVSYMASVIASAPNKISAEL